MPAEKPAERSERLVTRVDEEPKPALVTLYDPRTGRAHKVGELRAAVLRSRGFTDKKR